MAEGAGAAYQQLKVPNDGLSQSIQFWGKQQGDSIDAIANRQERAGIRKETRKNQLIDGLNLEAVVATYSTSKSLNSMTTLFAQNVTDKVSDYGMLGREAIANDDMTSYYKYLSKAKKAQSSMKGWNGMVEKMGVSLDAYAKASMNNELNPNDRTSLIMDAIIDNNFIPSLDDGENFSMLVGIDRDANGEISPEERAAGEAYLKDGVVAEGFEFHVTDPYGVVDGTQSVFKKVPILGDTGLLSQLGQSIGILKVDNSTGRLITSNEGFDESKRANLTVQAEALLTSPETMAWVLTQATGSTKAYKDVDQYTKIEKDAAVKFLVDSTIAKYSTTTGTGFNAALAASDRGDAALVETKRANRVSEAKKKTEADGLMSNLLFDAQAAATGDPTGLYGRYTVDGSPFNVTDVIDTGESYTLIDKDSGGTTTVKKNERAFLEFKLRDNDEYKGITPEDVFRADPTEYRESKEIGVSEVTKDFESFFTPMGNFNGDDKAFAKMISEKYGVDAKDIEFLGVDIISVNGVRIDLKDKGTAMIKLNNALKSSDSKGIPKPTNVTKTAEEMMKEYGDQ
jgi:hypothetical protein